MKPKKEGPDMNPKKDSTPNLSPSTKDLDKPYNNNSPKIEDAMAPYCPINHGKGQSPRTRPPLSTLLSLMNEYKYFEEMLLADVDAVSIYCLISHEEGESPRKELSFSTTTPTSSMSAYESDKRMSLKIEDDVS